MTCIMTGMLTLGTDVAEYVMVLVLCDEHLTWDVTYAFLTSSDAELCRPETIVFDDVAPLTVIL